MMRKPVMPVATAAMLVVASAAISSRAEARHGLYRNFFGAYAIAPRYAPLYSYAAPYYAVPYRGYDRFGRNLNPDRQMVGTAE